jgi:transcriptional regulator with XRE-family HTH domain
VSTGPDRLATERLRALVEQLQASEDPPLSQAAVAKRLGMSGSALSKLINGTRELGSVLQERICERIALSPAFFWDADLRELDWTKNRTRRSDLAERPYSVHRATEQLIADNLDAMDDDHKAELRAVYFGVREPTYEMVAALWQAMRARDYSGRRPRAAGTRRTSLR